MISEAPDSVVPSKGLALACCGDVGVVVISAAPDGPMVAAIRRYMTSLARRRSAGIGLLFIATKDAMPPSSAARVAVAEMLEALRPHLKVMSAFIEGSGFGSSVKRSVFTWATSRMIGHTPVKAFANLGETADWLSRSCEGNKIACPSSDEVQRLVRGLYS